MSQRMFSNAKNKIQRSVKQSRQGSHHGTRNTSTQIEKSNTGIVREASIEQEIEINKEYISNFTEVQKDEYIALTAEELNGLDGDQTSQLKTFDYADKGS